MKVRSAVRYYLADNKNALIIYYVILTACSLAGVLWMKLLSAGNKGVTISFGPVEFCTIIFLFVAGICTMSDGLRLYLQNGVSRKTYFKVQTMGFLAISAVTALADSILSTILSLVSPNGYMSMYRQTYELQHAGNLPFGVSEIVQIFVWSFSHYFVFIVLGFFIRSIYYRMNKPQIIVFSVGMPVLINLYFIYINPVVNRLAESLGINFQNYIIKFTAPLIISCVLLAFSYLLLRKVNLK